jgi:hypothetical protein
MRGERENVQLVISPTICEKQPCKFTPTFSDLVDPKGNVIDASSFSWLEVGYVNAKKTTRYLPSGGGWLADPLLQPLIDPATSQQMFVSRPDGDSNALWISLGVPADAPPGQYSGTVSIQPTAAAQQDSTSASIGVTVTVWPLQLPTVKEIHQNFPEIWSFNTGSLKVMLCLVCIDLITPHSPAMLCLVCMDLITPHSHVCNLLADIVQRLLQQHNQGGDLRVCPSTHKCFGQESSSAPLHSDTYASQPFFCSRHSSA